MKTTTLFTLLFFTGLSFSQVQIGDDIDGEASEDIFGTSVSLSDDGSVLAIGAPFNDGTDFNAGHVRVFKYESDSWIQIGDDIDGEGLNDFFGEGVSLSGDGSILAIGAHRNDGNGSDSGHVRVFKYESDSWIQLGGDIDGENLGDQSGRYLSLSADGTILAIGATGNSDNGTRSGHVRIFKFESDSWIQVGDDIDGEAEFDLSGSSVSLSPDGNIVAIGAIWNDGSGENSGHVRVFINDSGSWSQLGNELIGENPEDELGTSVSLSDDGTVLAVGGFWNDGNGTNSGHVRVFKFTSGLWNQIGDDIDGEAAFDISGWRVSLSADGSIVAISAPGNDENGTSSGHVRVYINESGTWNQVGIDIDGEETEDGSGSSISLSADGTILAIGAKFNDGTGLSSGHVRVYDLSGLLSIDEIISNQISLVPNPANDIFKVQLPLNDQLQKIEVFTISGLFVKAGTSSTVTISDLSKGVYLIKITTSKGQSTKKLIVE